MQAQRLANQVMWLFAALSMIESDGVYPINSLFHVLNMNTLTKTMVSAKWKNVAIINTFTLTEDVRLIDAISVKIFKSMARLAFLIIVNNLGKCTIQTLLR